jgi:membrane protease YdiL (CAAX protease family)
VGVRWYIAALFIPAAVHLVSTALYLLAGGVQAASGDLSQDLFGLSGIPAWQRLLLLFSIFVLGFDGLGEELGWRGFALPALLKKYSKITASLILGLLWAFWHLPYALVEGSAMSNVPLIWHLLRILASSILITWIFVHTWGSVLLAILFHAAGNTTANFLPTLLPAAGDPQVSMISVGVQWLLVLVIMTLTGPAFFFSKPGARIEGGGVGSGALQ